MEVLRTTRAAPPTSSGARALSPTLPGEGCAGLGTCEAREVLSGDPVRRAQGPLEGRELRAPPRARGPEAPGRPRGFRPDRGLSAGLRLRLQGATVRSDPGQRLELPGLDRRAAGESREQESSY